MNVELGTTQKDRVTGFTGVVTGLCQYITGCSQALLTPKSSDDGSFKDAHWFDEQRLEEQLVPKVVLDNTEHTGFDKPAPKR